MRRKTRRKSPRRRGLFGLLAPRRHKPKTRLKRITGQGFTRRVKTMFTRVFVVLAVIFGVVPIANDLALGAMRPLDSNFGVSCRVVNVVDGDTVDLFCGIVRYRARLTGYDAPELFSPQCNAERVAASAAKWYLRSLFWRGEQMRVTFGGLDLYQRHLARIDIDGFNLADRMIAVGYGRAYEGGKRAGWCSLTGGAQAVGGAILAPDMER